MKKYLLCSVTYTFSNGERESIDKEKLCFESEEKMRQSILDAHKQFNEKRTVVRAEVNEHLYLFNEITRRDILDNYGWFIACKGIINFKK